MPIPRARWLLVAVVALFCMLPVVAHADATPPPASPPPPAATGLYGPNDCINGGGRGTALYNNLDGEARHTYAVSLDGVKVDEQTVKAGDKAGFKLTALTNGTHRVVLLVDGEAFARDQWTVKCDPPPPVVVPPVVVPPVVAAPPVAVLATTIQAPAPKVAPKTAPKPVVKPVAAAGPELAHTGNRALWPVGGALVGLGVLLMLAARRRA